MKLLTTFFIALSLAMDAFSVCVAAGVKTRALTLRHYFRFSFHFGLFQFLMPLIGYFGGIAIEKFISRFDHWVALFILSFIGLKMVWESFEYNDAGEKEEFKDLSRGISLVMLSIATSIDAAAVGFSFAALQASIVPAAAVIGIVCAICSAGGLYLGNKMGSIIGAWAERLGGVILVGIGIKILIEHTLAR